ncbi:MAG: alpha/beta fold hydrolase [Deltaproteobacteria bacterium]|nr:alpha/beta fold hydrolase [Deltaproteobacteria bacterium]MBI3293333.1 alpha/beta fold hydrolase [Deltaproteobacteria bacterium]
MQTRELRGLESGWIELGEEHHPILLMIHGYPDTPLVWEYQTRHFAKSFQVICPFVRGEGPSKGSRDLRRFGVRSQSLDFLQMLKEIDPSGERPVYLVGHDLGAVHAWNLAPLIGPRLKGLVIFNGLSLLQMLQKLKSPRQHLRSWYIYGMQLPWLPGFITRRFPERLARFAYDLGQLPNEKRPEVAADSLSVPLKQYRAFLRDMLRQARQPQRPLSAPVLVVWGERDPFFNNLSVKDFEGFADNVTVRCLPKGHWVFREEPEQVNRLLENFFWQDPTGGHDAPHS